MKDTVAIAMITGGVGIFSNAMLWLAGRRTAGVELRRIAAEAERLRRQHEEVDRHYRRDVYHEMLFSVQKLNLLAGGYSDSTRDAYDKWLSDFYDVYAKVDLAAPREVRDAMAALDARLEAYHAAIMATPGDYDDAVYTAWVNHREAVMDATEELTSLMRADLIDDPSQ